MSQLYYNASTKVIYASDDEQNPDMQSIQKDDVADLIANGATVDPSADSLMGNDGVATASQDAPSAALGDAQVTADNSGESGVIAQPQADAVANDPTTPATVIPTTDTPVAEVENVPGNGAATSASSVDTAQDNVNADSTESASTALTPETVEPTGPGAEVNTGDPAAVNAAVDEPTTLHSDGTTVDVTQVDGQQVNSNVQTGNQLAGSDAQQATGNVLVNDTKTVDAPAVDGDTQTLTNTETQLNPLVPAAGTEGPPASQIAAQQAEEEPEPLPRESHLMLLEAKFEHALAKLRNAERIALDELEAIYAHVKAVL